MKPRITAQSAAALLTDYFFPSECVVCGRAVRAEDDGVCRPCLGDIIPVQGACPRCSGAVLEGRCGICSDRAWYPRGGTAAAEYSGAMMRLLRGFKFEGRKRLRRHLGDLLFAALKDEFLDIDVVTSVPMTPSKKWRRGYNQSELVAMDLSKRLGSRYERLLREKGTARTQKDLKYVDRFINILGRYEVRKRDLNGATVLLVDDVFTTGATLNECARVLVEAGAGSVYVAAMARRSLSDE